METVETEDAFFSGRGSKRASAHKVLTAGMLPQALTKEKEKDGSPYRIMTRSS